ncbi:MAG TPA: hypothetical protein VGP85_19265 [Pyrinomonadaceae bacterium]|jgi:hypothetical protein|nr:hypothetical protein [Pyrinomonadaceae bacterium]
MLQLFLSRGVILTILLASAVACVHAQRKGKWQRVYTGEGSVIDINFSSSALEPQHILRAEFRTILAKEEFIADRQGARYKSRVETIRFKLNEKRYRLCDSAWFDAKGRKVYSFTPTVQDWRDLKQGGVMERLYNSTRALAPFGIWKVVAYKFAEGGQPVRHDFNLEKSVGMRVRFETDRAEVGAKVCSSIAYEDHRASDEELNRKLGVQLESLGIRAESADTTTVTCEAGWNPPETLLIKAKEREMLMLWDGVFLVLKREREWTGDILH